MPTLMTDPRSGGVKKNSGVNVLSVVSEIWSEVRDDSNSSVDWLIASYNGSSKTDVTVYKKGNGGLDACALELPEGKVSFGGLRLSSSGRFVSFLFLDDNLSVLQKGRASMHKNGVLNVLEGCDCEIEMNRELTENNLKLPITNQSSSLGHPASRNSTVAKSTMTANNDSTSTQSRLTPPPIHRKTKTEMASPFLDGNNAKFKPINEDKTQSDNGPQPYRESDDFSFVPYELIRGISDISFLPEGVDPLNREQSLSDEEFYQVFAMDKCEFLAQPAWKRLNLKKKKELF